MRQPVSEFAAQTRRASAGLCAPMRWPRHALAVALALGLSGWSGMATAANCRNNGSLSAIICDVPANVLQPYYSTFTSNATITVTSAGSLGVGLTMSGTALGIQGQGVTLDNSGRIDPFTLGTTRSIASNGVAFTAAGGSMQTIINRANGIIGGASGDHAPTLTDLTGLALAVQNGPLGTTTIENQKDGKITAGIIASSTRAVLDAPSSPPTAVAVNITNDGTIIGRVALQGPIMPGAPGNTFINAGSIQGSVSMGAGGVNVFTARSGSSVTGIGNPLDQYVGSAPGLRFIAPARSTAVAPAARWCWKIRRATACPTTSRVRPTPTSTT